MSSQSPGRGRRPVRPSGEDRERDILATAERLLGERSYDQVSVDDLARGAGISRPTFYFYFPSKEAVLLALLDRVVVEAREHRRDVVPADAGPRDLVTGVITAIEAAFRTHRAVTVATVQAAATSAAVREVWAGIMDGYVRETTELIEAERARGAAPPGPPARDLAVALNAMNEQVLRAGVTGDPPALAPGVVVATLAEVWSRVVYGVVPARAPVG